MLRSAGTNALASAATANNGSRSFRSAGLFHFAREKTQVREKDCTVGKQISGGATNGFLRARGI